MKIQDKQFLVKSDVRCPIYGVSIEISMQKTLHTLIEAGLFSFQLSWSIHNKR